MTIQLDSVTRNTGIDPPVEPVNCTIAYSGASTATQLTFGSLFGPVLATGGSGSGSLTADIPSPNSLATINPGGVSGWGVSDSGVSSDGIGVDVPPFPPSPTAKTQLSTLQWQFGPAAYFDFHSLVGGGAIPEPFDYWWGDPGGVDTYSLSRVFGGSSDWIIGLPYSSFEWDFGDGSTSTASNPIHTYAAPGAYTITLTLDYSPFLVPPGFPVPNGLSDGTAVTGPSTIAMYFLIYMPTPSGGWHVGRIGMG